MRAVITISAARLNAVISHARELETSDDAEALDGVAIAEDELEAGPALRESVRCDAREGEPTNGLAGDIYELLDDLTTAELSEILALAWVGERSYGSAAFSRAVESARGIPLDDILLLLTSKPDLADAIEAGLIALGIRPAVGRPGQRAERLAGKD